MFVERRTSISLLTSVIAYMLSIMKIGLIGLPSTGKTTFFQLLTGTDSNQNKSEANPLGIAKVPDDRIDFLSGIYKPKKTTYATIEVTDIQGIQPSTSTGKELFLTFSRSCPDRWMPWYMWSGLLKTMMFSIQKAV